MALLSGCGGGPVTVVLPASRKPPCVERDAALVGWLDGDARPDRVVMADDGKDTTMARTRRWSGGLRETGSAVPSVFAPW
ncbi:hypothetical protein ACFRDV_23685 [Streptomyces fagopyri]|uniref:hypothetical protein n=1 Tax=Streptomyces fagopyri TaxID=2662397 RepID=UPI0036784995